MTTPHYCWGLRVRPLVSMADRLSPIEFWGKTLKLYKIKQWIPHGDDLHPLGLTCTFWRSSFPFFTARHIQLKPGKSSSTLFISWIKKYRLELDAKFGGVKIPTINYPKSLRVTFNGLHSLTPHIITISSILQSRNKLTMNCSLCRKSSDPRDHETSMLQVKEYNAMLCKDFIQHKNGWIVRCTDML